MVSGPSVAYGDCSSVPFPSEGSTLPTFLPWFPPDPPRASPLCVESVGRLPALSVLRLWLASLSAAVTSPLEGPFLTGSQSLGLGVLAMVSWSLIPLFHGWFLSCCACASLSLSLSLFLLGCFVPLSARCRCLLRPPCSLFLLVLRGLLASFIWGVLFLLVVFLPGICLVFSLLRGPPLIPCPWSLSLFVSLPGRSSFCCRWQPLVGLETFRLLLLVSSLGVALFLSPFLVFRRCLSLPFVLSFALFCCGLFGILWVLLRLSSSCVPFGLFGCASFPSCPSSLFLSPRSPSRSLAPHAFSFFRVVLEGAISSASRSLPSAPCSSYSSASSFLSSRPRSSLRAWVGGVLVFLRSAPLSSLLLAHS